MTRVGPAQEPASEDFREKLFRAVRYERHEELKKFFDIIRNTIKSKRANVAGNQDKLPLQEQDYRDKTEGNETLLHHAVLHTKIKSGHECMKEILTECPQLIHERKTLIRAHKHAGHMHMVYKEQTALHIAVARRDVTAAEMILNKAGAKSDNSDCSKLIDLLHQKVEGQNCKDTCMEGELPLSIAAWNTDIKMIDILLSYGAQRDAKNSKGDTVFHTLVKLFSKQAAQESEERQTKLKETFEHLLETVKVEIEPKNSILEDIKPLYETITNNDTRKHHIKAYFLSLTDKRNLTPLALAARKGVHSIFKTIVGVKGVYKFLDNTDGVSDVYLYDVTEIDSAVSRNTKTSVLERIPFSKPKQALQFMEISPIKEIIQAKWSRYRWIFLGWTLLHLLMMTFITYSISLRQNLYKRYYDTNLTNFNDTYRTRSGSNGCELNFLTMEYTDNAGDTDFMRVACDSLFALYILILLISETISLILDLKYSQASKGTAKGTPSWKQIKKYMPRSLDNGPYRIILILFILSSISSVVFEFCNYTNEDEPMVVMLISGWYFIIFFTRPYKKFSFFTLLIQKVVFGDMLRFSFVFIALLVAFASAMFVEFKDSDTIPAEFESLAISMFSLFKLALGLIDVEVLWESRKPHLTTIIFIIFVLLAYVLLMNMLIALLSDTMSLIKNDKTNQWKLQQLSVIRFIEPRLLSCSRFCSGTQKSLYLYVLKSGPEKQFERQEQTRYYKTIKTQTIENYVDNTYVTSKLFEKSFDSSFFTNESQRQDTSADQEHTDDTFSGNNTVSTVVHKDQDETANNDSETQNQGSISDTDRQDPLDTNQDQHVYRTSTPIKENALPKDVTFESVSGDN